MGGRDCQSNLESLCAVLSFAGEGAELGSRFVLPATGALIRNKTDE